MKIIETPRLYLREILPEDAESLFEMDADPEVHKHLGNYPIQNIIQASANIAFIRQQYLDNGIGRLAIVEKDTDQFVGWGGFKLIKEFTNGHQNYFDLGYRFLKRYWHKGYATESTKGVIDYGFDTLKLPLIYAIADMKNSGSRHVLEKCGFRYINTFDYDNIPHAWYELINHSINVK
jgi:ribosomal-protein-alanine N-acetyltransferase